MTTAREQSDQQRADNIRDRMRRLRRVLREEFGVFAGAKWKRSNGRYSVAEVWVPLTGTKKEGDADGTVQQDTDHVS